MKDETETKKKKKQKDHSSEFSTDEEINPDSFIYLQERVETYPSIESVKLKLNDNTKAPRHVYGEIKVMLDQLGRCIYIFHRHGTDPQPIIPQHNDNNNNNDNNGGFDLILCGPTDCLEPDLSSIVVDLYGDNAEPLCSGEFFLEENELPGNYHKPLYAYLDLIDNIGKLCLCYTKIHSGIPLRFEFRIDGDDNDDDDGLRGGFAVIGKIRALHKLYQGTNPNWLTVFEGRAELSYGDPIPLPRTDFMAHAQLGEEGDEGFFGGSLAIDADLQVVLNDGNRVYCIKGETDVVVHQFDKIWMPLYFVLKSQKRKEPSSSSSGGDDGLRIKITALPFHEFYPEGDEMVLIHG